MVKYDVCVVRVRINMVNVGAIVIRFIYFHYQCNSKSSKVAHCPLIRAIYQTSSCCMENGVW